MTLAVDWLSTELLAVRWLSAGLLATAAWQDCRSYRIPNQLPLSVATLAIGQAALSGTLTALPWVEALLLLAAGLALWRARVMGAGDVKLICACSLWFPHCLGSFILLTACFGGLLSLVILAWAKLHRRAAPLVPYGLAVSAAGIALLLGPPGYRALY